MTDTSYEKWQRWQENPTSTMFIDPRLEQPRVYNAGQWMLPDGGILVLKSYGNKARLFYSSVNGQHMSIEFDVPTTNIDQVTRRAIEAEASVRAANKDLNSQITAQAEEIERLQNLAGLYQELFTTFLEKSKMTINSEGERSIRLGATTFTEDKVPALFEYVDETTQDA